MGGKGGCVCACVHACESVCVCVCEGVRVGKGEEPRNEADD